MCILFSYLQCIWVHIHGLCTYNHGAVVGWLFLYYFSSDNIGGYLLICHPTLDGTTLERTVISSYNRCRTVYTMSYKRVIISTRD